MNIPLVVDLNSFNEPFNQFCSQHMILCQCFCILFHCTVSGKLVVQGVHRFFKYFNLTRQSIDISKKTARYLLTSGLVPCIDTGKKTRQYIINTKDVITYLKKRQSQPEKFSAPTGYYSASWNKGGKPKMLTLREWANLDTAKSRKKFQDFLTLKMQPYSDVLSVAEASRFTGYHHNTLTNWCHNGYIRYFEISGGYMIPKSCLLNFLLSPHILDSYRPSKKLVDLAKEFSRQGKSTKKPTAK